ncbi:hypothetical protein EV177_010867, partial [Coemansia sp. RSA 1804]
RRVRRVRRRARRPRAALPGAVRAAAQRVPRVAIAGVERQFGTPAGPTRAGVPAHPGAGGQARGPARRGPAAIGPEAPAGHRLLRNRARRRRPVRRRRAVRGQAAHPLDAGAPAPPGRHAAGPLARRVRGVPVRGPVGRRGRLGAAGPRDLPRPGVLRAGGPRV